VSPVGDTWAYRGTRYEKTKKGGRCTMTKSRTLRKAAAVALSLAMAFSVAGTTTANAAAKPSLKKTKVTVKVTVKNPVKVTKVKLNKKKVKLTTGQTYRLKATIKPKKATNKNVTWTSSNTSVATVDANGNVTAIAPGKATITCKAKDGSKKKAKCKIIVK